MFRFRSRIMALSSFVVFGGIVAIAAPAQAEDPVHFDSSAEPAFSNTTETGFLLLNDSGARALVRKVVVTVTADGGAQSRLPVRLVTASGDAVETGGFVLRSARSVVVVFPTPSTAGSGWLTAVVRYGGARHVLRRAVTFPGYERPAPIVDSRDHADTDPPLGGGHEVRFDVPATTTAAACARGTVLGTVLVQRNDDSVTLTARCAETGVISFRGPKLPSYGTFEGKGKIAGSTIDISVSRSRGILSPIGAILLGVIVGLLALGYSDWGWWRQDRGWMRTLRRDLRRADKAFASAAQQQPGDEKTGWQSYTIAGLSDVDRLGAQLMAMRRSQSWFRHLLPSPGGYLMAERTSVLADMKALEELCARWASAPIAFARARRAGVELVDAPGARRALAVVVNGHAALTTTSEVTAVLAEIDAAPVAATLLERASTLHDTVTRCAELPDLGDADRDLCDKATQVDRQLRARIAEATGIARLVSAVDAPLRELTDLLDRLPDRRVRTANVVAGAGLPAPSMVHQSTMASDAARRELAPPAVRQLVAQIGSRALTAFAVLASLAVGLLAGLVPFYFGTVWGTPVDIAKAFVIGLGAPTLIVAPLQALIRSSGARLKDVIVSR